MTQKMLSLFLLAGMLAACGAPLSSSQAIPTAAMQTALSIARTELARPQTATPETTPTLARATPVPAPGAIIPPGPDEQVYTDPAGWYVVNIPADMQPGEKPNFYFRPSGGFFETGYLPEMGYMSNAANVLHWLSDLGFKPGQGSFEDPKAACPTPAGPNDAARAQYQIFENPGADPAHRFVYIETGVNDPNNPLRVTFSWLEPVSKTRAETGPNALSPEETAFWAHTGPMPTGISVSEDEPQPQPSWKTQANASPTPKKITIKELGYEIRTVFPFHSLEGDFLLPELYRDGRPLLGYAVVDISDVYTFQTRSGRINAFVVQVDTGKAREHFLIQNDAIRVWDAGQLDSMFAPILYQDQLLWLGLQGTHDVVKNSAGDVLCSFDKINQPMEYPTFRSWNGHWIFAVDDFVVQDGVVLNQKLGYQEIFGWGLVNDKPLYFFRKGARVGISYDGQILPLQYDNVTHGYACCGSPPDGIGIYLDDYGLHFYAERDGAWHYVLLKFN